MHNTYFLLTFFFSFIYLSRFFFILTWYVVPDTSTWHWQDTSMHLLLFLKSLIEFWNELLIAFNLSKTVRVVLYAEDAAAEEARTAGTNVVGGDGTHRGDTNWYTNSKPNLKCVVILQFLVVFILKFSSLRVNFYLVVLTTGSLTYGVPRLNRKVVHMP